MTAPRMLIPQTTYLVTRRCIGRQFLLRPDKNGLVRQIFEFCLAFSAWRTGVSVHAYCVLSNHWHAVVTDPKQRLPEFMHDVNLLVGKCMNVFHKRFESLWSSEKYSAVQLVRNDDIIEKIVYVLTNPVAAALVPSWKKWPGAISGPSSHLEEARWIPRPELFFRDDSGMPGAVLLELTMPEALDAWHTPEELAKMLERRVKERQKELLEKHANKGRKVLGKTGIFSQDPFDCPKGYDPRGGINPRVACKDKWGRIEALQRLKWWLQQYREAWHEYKNGNRQVLFPYGTYWVVNQLQARVAAPG